VLHTGMSKIDGNQSTNETGDDTECPASPVGHLSKWIQSHFSALMNRGDQLPRQALVTSRVTSRSNHLKLTSQAATKPPKFLKVPLPGQGGKPDVSQETIRSW